MTIAPTVRPSTLDKYQRDLRAHVIRHIGFVLLSKLDGPELNRLWAPLADAHRAGRIELAGTRASVGAFIDAFAPSPVASIVATESPG